MTAPRRTNGLTREIIDSACASKNRYTDQFCWERVAAGERMALSFEAMRRLSKRLNFDMPLTEEEVDAAWQEVLAQQRATLRITRAKMGEYMRTEQVAIEVERLGLAA